MDPDRPKEHSRQAWGRDDTPPFLGASGDRGKRRYGAGDWPEELCDRFGGEWAGEEEALSEVAVCTLESRFVPLRAS